MLEDLGAALRQIVHKRRFFRALALILPDSLSTFECGWADVLRGLHDINATSTVHKHEKGKPDLARIKRELSAAVTSRLGAAEPARSEWPDIVQKCRELAAADLNDVRGLNVYLSAVYLANRKTIDLLRRYSHTFAIVHISCSPRLDRAFASVKSFEEISDTAFAQLTIVGGGKSNSYDFDQASGVLSVPEGDGYDQLPAKVLSAVFILSIFTKVRAVLKVDDDHRLANAALLLKNMRRADADQRATVRGMAYQISAPGRQGRCWHMGKCGGSAMDAKPFTALTATRWATGERGYIVGREAMRTLSWSYIYFQSQIDHSLYEDLCVSHLLSSHGGRVTHTDMSLFINSVDEY